MNEAAVTMYRIEFKCRRCGEVYEGRTRCKRNVFYSYINQGDSDKDLHDCEDGGLGWADVIGARDVSDE